LRGKLVHEWPLVFRLMHTVSTLRLPLGPLPSALVHPQLPPPTHATAAAHGRNVLGGDFRHSHHTDTHAGDGGGGSDGGGGVGVGGGDMFAQHGTINAELRPGGPVRVVVRVGNATALVCGVHLCCLLCCSLRGATARVTFICVFCTLRTQMSRHD
jgi:hypothetical protein